MAKRFVIVQSRRLEAAENGGRHIIFGSVTDSYGRPMVGVRLLMTWEYMTPDQLPGLYAYTGGAGNYEFTTTMGVFFVEVAMGIPSARAEGLRNTVNEPEPGHTSYQVDFRLEDDSIIPPEDLGPWIMALDEQVAVLLNKVKQLIDSAPPTPGWKRILWLFGR